MNSRDDAERLYLENEKLVHGALHQYFPALAFDEDIQQIARIGLWKACLSYQEDRARFSTAAYKFIANEVRMELRRKSRKMEALTVSLNELLPDSNGTAMDCAEFLDVMSSTDDIDWCDFEAFWTSLTQRQRIIVTNRMAGRTGRAIAHDLGVCPSVVIREKQKIRQKADETL